MNYASLTTLTTNHITHTHTSAALPVLLFILLYNIINGRCEIMQKAKAISFSPPLHLNGVSQYLFCRVNPHCPRRRDGLDGLLVAEAYTARRHVIPSGLPVSQ